MSINNEIIQREMLGKVYQDVSIHRYYDDGHDEGFDVMIFHTSDLEGVVFCPYDEDSYLVEIIDICGDLRDLINSPILEAEVISDAPGKGFAKHGESYEWTFYKYATIKGSVTVRWYGESNGYYATDVDMVTKQYWKRHQKCDMDHRGVPLPYHKTRHPLLTQPQDIIYSPNYPYRH
jgi:hypothetical protein